MCMLIPTTSLLLLIHVMWSLEKNTISIVTQPFSSGSHPFITKQKTNNVAHFALFLYGHCPFSSYSSLNCSYRGAWIRYPSFNFVSHWIALNRSKLSLPFSQKEKAKETTQSFLSLSQTGKSEAKLPSHSFPKIVFLRTLFFSITPILRNPQRAFHVPLESHFWLHSFPGPSRINIAFQSSAPLVLYLVPHLSKLFLMLPKQ